MKSLFFIFIFFTGELLEAIKRDFGSFQKMKEKMSAATVAVQGSGWGWLGFDKDSGRLRIAACANQDPLQGTSGKSSTINRREYIYFGSKGLNPPEFTLLFFMHP